LGSVARILAIDLGKVRMGLAVSDELGITAQPLPTWRRKGIRADVAHLKGLMEVWGVERVVLGYPRRLGGDIGEMASRAQEFAKQLEEALAIPVTLWDERYSTAEAERTLIEAGVGRQRRRELRDGVAVLLILQNYLDRRAREG
jgi:putative Holliday junction resolvase